MVSASMVSMVYHGILPWFTSFKTPWYFNMEYDGVFSYGIGWIIIRHLSRETVAISPMKR